MPNIELTTATSQQKEDIRNAINALGVAVDSNGNMVGVVDPNGEVISDSINAKAFGCKFDGVTDDTVALQAFIDAVCAGTTGYRGVLPAGEARISAPLVVPFGVGWKLNGAGGRRTTITQTSSNTPIFRFMGNLTHGFHMADMTLTWATQQTAGSNPSSVAIYFDGANGDTVFNFALENMFFGNGYRAIAINPARNSLAVWGAFVRNCTFAGNLTGSAVRLSCATAIGQPNINLENLYIDCAAATEESIYIEAGTGVNLRGVEFNNGTYNTVSQLVISSSTAVSLLNCRSEVPVVSTAGTKQLWIFPNTDVALLGCQINAPICSGGGILIGVNANTNGRLNIFGLQLTGTRADGGFLAPYLATSVETVSGLVCLGGWVTNPRSVLGAVEMPSVNAGVMTADATQNVGDTSIVLTTTSYRTQYFNTTLTANRTCTLPSTGLLDGMEFHIVRYNNTPGAFTLTVSDPVSGKSYVIPSGTRGFVRWRAVSTGEWLPVEAGTFP